MKVPLLDLKAQYASIKDEIDNAVADVLASQRFVLGPAVEACEEEVARYCGCAHAVGASSGTDALLAVLMAERIRPGDEVITTPFTFFSTAGVVARLGAVPVFADIDPATFNIDPAKIEARVTERTRAIVPVHLFGQIADMDPVTEIAEHHGLLVVEDAAQAIGAERDGRRAGSFGHYGCFSFFPSKNLGGYGDGGMVTTNDEDRAARLRAIRVHGEARKYHHHVVGGNFRLDALQAAVLSAKLPHLDAWSDARARNAALYARIFGETPARIRDRVRLPQVEPGRHVFNQFVVRVPNRDRVQARLAAAGVGCAVYYPVPLHLQRCFATLGYARGDLPEAEKAADEVLALPVYPELSEAQVRYVAEAVAAAVDRPTPGPNHVRRAGPTAGNAARRDEGSE